MAQRRAVVLVGVVLLSVLASGCSGDDDAGPATTIGMLESLGAGEGRLDLVAWPGFVENGSSNARVDWVTGFEQRTGCRVRVTLASSPEELVKLVRTREFDGASVSGDVSRLLIASGDVAPVNTELIPNYADVVDALKDRPHNSVAGRPYGVPQGRGANVLMYRTDVVEPAPESWSIVFEPDPAYEGKVMAYGSPISIADAAVYLKDTRPELGIDNVYELDDEQFRAAVAVADRQRLLADEYWSDYTLQQASFAAGNTVVGAAWQLTADALRADGVPVETLLPRGGATGWSDTWMVSSTAKHPTCMYLWMDHVLSPEVNAAVAEWYGQAPSNRKACALTRDRGHCARYHATDEAFFSRVALWTTPLRECGDGRGRVCKTWAEWVEAWEAIHE